MSTGPTAKTRQLVLERDGYACVSCWTGIRGPNGYSIHHRIPRGMGGSRRPDLNLPANLLTLCGSGTTGCHGWVEANRIQARTWGYLLHRNLDPTLIPVFTAGGYVKYDAEGCITYVDNPNFTPEKKAQLERDTRRARDLRAGTTKGSPDHRKVDAAKETTP